MKEKDIYIEVVTLLELAKQNNEPTTTTARKITNMVNSEVIDKTIKMLMERKCDCE